MAKKKSKRKPPPSKKAIEPMPMTFDCPFCNHNNTVEVKLDRNRNTAKVSCRICNEDYQTTINYLSEAIDVYSQWIDECEKVNSV